MLTVSALKNMCDNIILEYGGDSKVAIQVYDVVSDKIHIACYAMDCDIDDDGTLLIMNKEE